MSERKHTPGPWAVHHNPDWNQWSVRSANPSGLADAPIYYELADRIGGHVLGESFDDYSEVEANARLIAAAPELLEALEQFVAWVDAPCESAFSDSQLASARAAIAKATGESK